MQISAQEVTKIWRLTSESSKEKAPSPVRSVSELAEKYGVRSAEVARFTERALLAEEDVARERRVQEIENRLAAGTYRVEAEAVVDMAKRRADADRAAEI
jgi:anti-sigma28 factor (negative regulator of flagellin synthesis)